MSANLLVWLELLLLRKALVKVLVEDSPFVNLKEGNQDAIGGLLLKGGIYEHSGLQVLQRERSRHLKVQR